MIPLNETAIAAREAHAAWYTGGWGRAGPKGSCSPSGRLCPKTRRAHHVAQNGVDQGPQEAGVKGRWHDHRHASVTELAESGAGDEVIMSIAGHVSRAMLSRYSHVRMEAKRRALDEIAVRQRAADEKRKEEAERQAGSSDGPCLSPVIQ